MRPRLLVPLLIPALLLPAACGGGAGDGVSAEQSAVPSASASSAPPQKTDPNAKLPTLSTGKEFGAEPTLATEGDPPPDIRFSVLSEGDGPEVKAGDLLVADYKLQAWGSPDAADGTFGDGPLLRTIGKGEISPGWDAKIPGVKVGSRVLLVEPGSAGTQMAGRTLVFVIDVLGALDAKAPADGSAVTPEKSATALPEVSGGADPTITIPKGDPPTELVAQLLLKGKGKDLGDGQLAVVHYTGVLWKDGKQFDSSWDREGGPSPFSFQIGKPGIIAAWNEGLKGKAIGSRVLLVVPPDKGYGKEGQPSAGIGPTDTMVFVVDLLAAY